MTYFIWLIGQAGLDLTDDQIDGTKKLFESYEELLIVSYSNSQRKKFVVFVDSLFGSLDSSLLVSLHPSHLFRLLHSLTYGNYNKNRTILL